MNPEKKRKTKIVLWFFCLLLIISNISSCYSYSVNLRDMHPEEVIFEFNRILNRIDEPEYFKGILSLTTDVAYKEANKLIKLSLLKDTNRVAVIKEDIQLIMNYYKRLKIIVNNVVKETNNSILFKVIYYDEKTKFSDFKLINLSKKNNVWKISYIQDI